MEGEGETDGSEDDLVNTFMRYPAENHNTTLLYVDHTSLMARPHEAIFNEGSPPIHTKPKNLYRSLQLGYCAISQHRDRTDGSPFDENSRDQQQPDSPSDNLLSIRLPHPHSHPHHQHVLQ